MPQFGGSIGEVGSAESINKNIQAPIQRDNISGEFAQSIGGMLAQAPSKFRQGMLQSDLEATEQAYTGEDGSPAKQKAVERTKKLFDRMRISYDAGNMTKTQFDIATSRVLKEAVSSFPGSRGEFIGTAKATLGYDPTGSAISAKAAEERAAQVAREKDREEKKANLIETGTAMGLPKALFDERPDDYVDYVANHIEEYTATKIYDSQLTRKRLESEESKMNNEVYKIKKQQETDKATQLIGYETSSLVNGAGQQFQEMLAQDKEIAPKIDSGGNVLTTLSNISADRNLATKALQVIEINRNQVKASLSAKYQGSRVSPSIIESNMKIIDANFDLYKAVLNGDQEASFIKKQLQYQRDLTSTMALKNPDVAQASAFANLGINVPDSVIVKLLPEAFDKTGHYTKSVAEEIAKGYTVFSANPNRDLSTAYDSSDPHGLYKNKEEIGSTLLDKAVSTTLGKDAETDKMIVNSLAANAKREKKNLKDLEYSFKAAAYNPDILVKSMKVNPEAFAIYQDETNNDGIRYTKDILRIAIDKNIGADGEMLVAPNGNVYFKGGDKKATKLAQSINLVTDTLAHVNGLSEGEKVKLKRGIADVHLLSRRDEMRKIYDKSLRGQIASVDMYEQGIFTPMAVGTKVAGKIGEIAANLSSILLEAATVEILAPLVGGSVEAVRSLITGDTNIPAGGDMVDELGDSEKDAQEAVDILNKNLNKDKSE